MHIEKTEMLYYVSSKRKGPGIKACPSRCMTTSNELYVTWIHILNFRQYWVPNLGSLINCMSFGCVALTPIIFSLWPEISNQNSPKATQQLYTEGLRKTNGGRVWQSTVFSYYQQIRMNALSTTISKKYTL